VLMLLLINNKRIMGSYTNGLAFNVIAWATVVIVGVLTIVSTVQQILAPTGTGG
jgi:Mn2+/Fe2+ NRAMP family transporter